MSSKAVMTRMSLSAFNIRRMAGVQYWTIPPVQMSAHTPVARYDTGKKITVGRNAPVPSEARRCSYAVMPCIEPTEMSLDFFLYW